jgi:methylase of polypeptide subunit release factors
MIPVRLGTPDQFATVREFLRDAEYTAPKIAERVGVPTIYHFGTIRQGRTQATAINDRLDLLIRIFMDAQMVERSETRRHVPDPVIAALEALGLIVNAPSSSAHVNATVLMYPSAGGVVISDLNADPDKSAPEPSPPDVVYPAITDNTRRFLASQSTTPCEHFLELCGGTGVAALRASRFAKRAWTVDITERSTVFAEFNIRLNGLANVASLRGDLYEPVRGLTFDRIVIHPPYVPARRDTFAFRDGGEDGESVTRRAIAGLPEFLRPGGRFYCQCQATDRKGAPLERRVRAFLGEKEAEFDVLVAVTSESNPLAYYASGAARRHLSFADAGEWHALFQQLEVTHLVYGSVVIQRHRDPCPAMTLRRQMGAPDLLGRGDDWLFAWEAAAAAPNASARILAARPWASARGEITITLRAKAGEAWSPVKATMSTDWPFSSVVESPPLGADLVTRCDGRTSVAQHLAYFRESGRLPPEESDADFEHLVRVLISAGILGIDEFPIPPYPEAPDAP